MDFLWESLGLIINRFDGEFNFNGKSKNFPCEVSKFSTGVGIWSILRITPNTVPSGLEYQTISTPAN